MLGGLTVTHSEGPAARGLSSPVLAAFARVALALPFVVSGLLKALDFSGAIAEVRALTGVDESTASLIAALVIVVQLGGSALLLSGRRWAVTGGAALLFGFTIIATLLAHAWWTREGLDRARDFTVFVEHIAICGGLALTVVLVWRR